MLVEGVMDYAIFLLDPWGMVSSWNLGAEKIKGYKAEEIIGKPFSLLYPDHAVQSGMATYSLEIAKAEGHFEQEGWRKRKDGSFFWANTSISTLYNDAHQEIGYSVITRDPTSRKLMEEGLRESEERYRLLVEGVKDYAIFLLDPSGRVSSWNLGRNESRDIR